MGMSAAADLQHFVASSSAGTSGHWYRCAGAAILISYSQLDRLHDGAEPSLPPPRTESR
jgi:hypothetical protein